MIPIDINMTIIIISVISTNRHHVLKFVIILVTVLICIHKWSYIETFIGSVKNIAINNLEHGKDSEYMHSYENSFETTGLTDFENMSDANFAFVSIIDSNKTPQQGVDYKGFSTVSNKVPFQERNCMLIGSKQSMLKERSDQNDSGELIIDQWSITDGSNITADLNTKITNKYSDVLRQRNNWTSIPVAGSCSTPLQLPINKIYISETATVNCHSYSNCEFELNNMLIRHKLLWDNIGYNFVIAGDGTIFEGLSWKCKVHNKRTDNRSIWVSMTGYSHHDKIYMRDNKITEQQYNALHLLITANVIGGIISPSYHLLPYCCLLSGKNPGEEVFRRLNDFEHFCGFLCVNREQCDYH